MFDPDVDSRLYFVAVTYDALDREVNRGECGDPDERSTSRARSSSQRTWT